MRNVCTRARPEETPLADRDLRMEAAVGRVPVVPAVAGADQLGGSDGDALAGLSAARSPAGPDYLGQ